MENNNIIENLMLEYVEHKKIYNKIDETDEDFLFYQGYCECAENWMRALGYSPNCNFITDRLND